MMSILSSHGSLQPLKELCLMSSLPLLQTQWGGASAKAQSQRVDAFWRSDSTIWRLKAAEVPKHEPDWSIGLFERDPLKLCLTGPIRLLPTSLSVIYCRTTIIW